MNQEEVDFKKVENIIFCLAHKYANGWKVDFDDMVEIGYEYYAWCLNNFDNSKNMKFSTYLYMQINARMKDEIDRMKKQIDILYEDIKSPVDEKLRFEDLLKAKDVLSGDYAKELLAQAKKEISYEAHIILTWLLSYKWLRKGHTSPTQLFCQRETGLSKVSVETGFNEIKHWWLNSGWKISDLSEVA